MNKESETDNEQEGHNGPRVAHLNFLGWGGAVFDPLSFIEQTWGGGGGGKAVFDPLSFIEQTW